MCLEADVEVANESLEITRDFVARFGAVPSMFHSPSATGSVIRQSGSVRVQAGGRRVQRLATAQYQKARASRRQDEGKAEQRFMRAWVAPGIAAIEPGGAGVRLLLFMRRATRQPTRRHCSM